MDIPFEFLEQAEVPEGAAVNPTRGFIPASGVVILQELGEFAGRLTPEQIVVHHTLPFQQRVRDQTAARCDWMTVTAMMSKMPPVSVYLGSESSS